MAPRLRAETCHITLGSYQLASNFFPNTNNSWMCSKPRNVRDPVYPDLKIPSCKVRCCFNKFATFDLDYVHIRRWWFYLRSNTDEMPRFDFMVSLSEINGARRWEIRINSVCNSIGNSRYIWCTKTSQKSRTSGQISAPPPYWILIGRIRVQIS